MSQRTRLEQDEVQAALADLEGWSLQEDKLHRTFEFRDFVEAMGFMMRAALVAERMDHHPEWSNVYKRVRVDLTTHSAKGLTALDLKLATEMSRLAAS